jgi:hypothetical protein
MLGHPHNLLATVEGGRRRGRLLWATAEASWDMGVVSSFGSPSSSAPYHSIGIAVFWDGLLIQSTLLCHH